MEQITDTKMLGEWIRKIRKRQRITQEQLAATVGVGTRFVRELEQGKESCQIGKVLQVVQMLGVSIYILMRGSEASFARESNAEKGKGARGR